jgi:hypothetical protein
MKYYFTGTEIVEVEDEYEIIDNSDPRSESNYTDRTNIFTNMKTKKRYYINKGIQHYSININEGEIFKKKNELIDYKIKEFRDKILYYEDKILNLEKQYEK